MHLDFDTPTLALIESTPEFAELWAIWTAARGNGKVPRRIDLKLTGLDKSLEHLSVMDCRNPDDPRFWFLGLGPSERVGAAEGQSLLDIYVPEMRLRIGQWFRELITLPAAGIVRYAGETEGKDFVLLTFQLPWGDIEGQPRYVSAVTIPLVPDPAAYGKPLPWQEVRRAGFKALDLGFGTPSTEP